MPLTTKGCTSETGTLLRVVMCPPSNFEIVKPVNAVQWQYVCSGLKSPSPTIMVQQHERVVEELRRAGVEVDLLPAVQNLPYQHATRDMGVVVGDRIVCSPRIDLRRDEVKVARSVFETVGLQIIEPKQGYVEGGDVIVEGGRIWVGIGGRTDERGADYLDRLFGHEYDVIPLTFDPIYTHLDTLFGVLGKGKAILYEPAIEAVSLKRIREVYPDVVLLSNCEQKNAGANVLCVSPTKVISIAENVSVNNQLEELGYDVIALPFSEVIKSGGSVRCDTLPIYRE